MISEDKQRIKSRSDEWDFWYIGDVERISNGNIVDYYTADVVAVDDYYPGGMLLPGRHANSSEYRYKFNEMEIFRSAYV